MLTALDAETRTLVRLAAVVAGGTEWEVRGAIAEGGVRAVWVEELLLQSHLFAGFPRALNAMREWRRLGGPPAPEASARGDDASWRRAGEATCRRVYGAMYEKLRANIRALHPELDDWMIVDGYGKVLSRPALDLPRRELCIIASCVASAQERQLHSHLHGAVNVGVAPPVVDAALDALEDVVPAASLRDARTLWSKVRSQ